MVLLPTAEKEVMVLREGERRGICTTTTIIGGLDSPNMRHTRSSKVKCPSAIGGEVGAAPRINRHMVD